MDQRGIAASDVNTDLASVHLEEQTTRLMSIEPSESSSEPRSSRLNMSVPASTISTNEVRPHSRVQRSRSDTVMDPTAPNDPILRDVMGHSSSVTLDPENLSEDAELLRPQRLTAALSTPVSGDAVSSRLLQALPQRALDQFLQELNNHTPPWRGLAAGRPNSSDNGAQEQDRGLRNHASSPPSPSSVSFINTPEDRADPLSAPGPTTIQSTDRAGTSTRPSEEGDDEQTAMDELRAIFRRCHTSLPFIALFAIYFAYQHATGIVVVVVGTVAVMGLDQRLRAQVALKDKANIWHLVGIVVMCAINMVALCSVDGQPNPLRHFSLILYSKMTHGSESGTEHDFSGEIFWQVLWTVVVNDFLIRLWSIVVKAFVAGTKSDRFLCERKYSEEEGTSVDQHASVIAIEDDEDASSTTMTSLTQHKVSTAAFHRRKRKLYGLIEMGSIFLRSLLASVPWCSLYQLCASKFMADVFAFAYLVVKGLVLAAQGRRIILLARSFIQLGLEFGVYVPYDEIVESGALECTICYETMHHPVKLACSHMFCEECVAEWFDHERSCPLCRASVGSGTLDEANVKPQFLDGRTSLVPQLL